MNTTTTRSGPLVFPDPGDERVDLRLLVTRRLGGHTTSEGWLPEGLSPGLDELREKHLLHRDRTAAALAALGDLASLYAEEDRTHTRRLEDAAREGARGVEDDRTPSADRDARRKALGETLWAEVVVLAEVADEVIAYLREHEDEHLADLRGQLADAHDKREEAARLLAEADSQAWRIQRTGGWIQTTADDRRGLGRQPAPPLEAPPSRIAPGTLTHNLERPWHRAPAWKGARAGVAA